MSEAGQPAPLAPRSSRLGRSAWLALGIGLTLFAILATVAFLTEPYVPSDKRSVILFTGVVAGVVCIFWLMLLAGRALGAKERATLPVLLLLLVAAVPIGFVGALLWVISGWVEYSEPAPAGLIQEWFLPVLLPYLSFIALSGAPLILLLLWRRNRRRAREGETALTPAERWKFARRSGAIYALVCAVLLLPVPVFVLSVLWSENLRTAIASGTPNFIRDGVESLAYRNKAALREFEQTVLMRGFVSDARLLERLHDSDGNVAYRAACGMKAVRNPATAARVIDDLRTSPGARNRDIFFYLAAMTGSTEQRRELLALSKSDKLNARRLFFGLAEAQADATIVEDLKRYADQADNAPENRIQALGVLVKWAAPAQREAMLRAYLQSSDPALPGALVRYSYFVGIQDDEFLVSWLALEHTDANIRAAALWNLRWNSRQKLATFQEYLDRMKSLLSDHDVVMRRLAARSVLYTTRLSPDFGGGKITLDAQELGLLDKYRKVSGRVYVPLPANSEEETVFESLKKKIEQWLKENDGGKK